MQLLYRQQEIAGAVSQRRHQPRVIGSAVMIDIVRSKRRARHALQHIILFIGSAIRTDEPNPISASPLHYTFHLPPPPLPPLLPPHPTHLPPPAPPPPP